MRKQKKAVDEMDNLVLCLIIEEPEIKENETENARFARHDMYD